MLDPFAGSGSTLVAAYRTNRHYAGAELHTTYFAAAQGRLAYLRRHVGADAAWTVWNDPLAIEALDIGG